MQNMEGSGSALFDANQQFLDSSAGSIIDLFDISNSYSKELRYVQADLTLISFYYV